MTKAAQLQSEAWLLRGISSIPGVLKLSRGRVSFTASGSGTAWGWQLRKLERLAGKSGLADRIDAGENALVFDAPLADVQIGFPWYYFGGGLIVQLADVRYKLSLGRPANTRLPTDSVAGALGRAAGEFKEVGHMRSAGKAWKAALTQEQGTR